MSSTKKKRNKRKLRKGNLERSLIKINSKFTA